MAAGKPLADTQGWFAPEAEPRAYRCALGRYATGVTVVTAAGQGGPVGITVNSFASVSLEPALVLWSAGKTSSRHAVFVGAEHFAIHVLSADQRDICEAFVRAQPEFPTDQASFNARGVPILDGCLAVFECQRETVHDAGDHSIIIGRVVRAVERAGTGLVFSHGGFERTDRKSVV
jgi:flavin reductase (DIM6/NTAB) family NADH-FMN oxidoreductase RutF